MFNKDKYKTAIYQYAMTNFQVNTSKSVCQVMNKKNGKIINNPMETGFLPASLPISKLLRCLSLFFKLEMGMPWRVK